MIKMVVSMDGAVPPSLHFRHPWREPLSRDVVDQGVHLRERHARTAPPFGRPPGDPVVANTWAPATNPNKISQLSIYLLFSFKALEF